MYQGNHQGIHSTWHQFHRNPSILLQIFSAMKALSSVSAVTCAQSRESWREFCVKYFAFCNLQRHLLVQVRNFAVRWQVMGFLQRFCLQSYDRTGTKRWRNPHTSSAGKHVWVGHLMKVFHFDLSLRCCLSCFGAQSGLDTNVWVFKISGNTKPESVC